MTDRDDVLRRIRALLLKTVANGNGCPVEEALAAHEKVRKLIDKYQVSHEELYGTESRQQQRSESDLEPDAAEATKQAYSGNASNLNFRSIHAVIISLFLAPIVAS